MLWLVWALKRLSFGSVPRAFALMAVVNGLTLSATVAMSRRWFGRSQMMATAVTALVITHALGGRELGDFWNPYPPVVWFFAFVVGALALGFDVRHACTDVDRGVRVACRAGAPLVPVPRCPLRRRARCRCVDRAWRPPAQSRTIELARRGGSPGGVLDSCCARHGGRESQSRSHSPVPAAAPSASRACGRAGPRGGRAHAMGSRAASRTADRLRWRRRREPRVAASGGRRRRAARRRCSPAPASGPLRRARARAADHRAVLRRRVGGHRVLLPRHVPCRDRRRVRMARAHGGRIDASRRANDRTGRPARRGRAALRSRWSSIRSERACPNRFGRP